MKLLKHWIILKSFFSYNCIKNFKNRWLGKACQNGGQIPVLMSDKKLEKQIAKQKKYEEEAMIESAPHEEWIDFVKNIKTNMGKKWTKIS